MCDPAVSVLVVSYNAADSLPACLDAVFAQTLPADRYEVIVTDNASADGSADLVAARYPAVRLIRLGRNAGFAAGNNAAGAVARGKLWALLNPDTVPDPFWLEEVLRAADEHPGAAIACKLVVADAPDRLNSAGLFLTRDGRGADRGFRQPDDGRYEAGGEVFAGCAAALVVHAPPAGTELFDARLFLYYEDLDFGWRWRLAGRRTVFAPRAVVRHVVGGAAGDVSPVFWYHVERNRVLTAVRYGDPVLAVGAVVGLLVRAVRAVLFSLVGHPAAKYRRANAAAVVRATIDVFRQLSAVLAERRHPRG